MRRRAASRSALVAALAVGRVAHADQYETSLHAHAVGGMAQLAEKGASKDATVPAVGVGARATYGVRNWLALEADLSLASFGEAHYDDLELSIGGGRTMVADVDRTTRAARLTIGPTLRGGVAWVPIAHLGVGGQARWQAAARVAGMDTSTPDGYGNSLVLDLMVTARIGLERRFGRRWTASVTAGVVHAFPLGGPAFDVVEGGPALGAYWY